MPTLTSGCSRYFSPSFAVSSLIELGGRQVGRLDFADQRHRDVAGQIDVIVAGQVGRT